MMVCISLLEKRTRNENFKLLKVTKTQASIIIFIEAVAVTAPTGHTHPFFL